MGILRALEILRVYRSLAGLGSGYRERGHPRYSGRARCLCSRCRRLRSSGTLAGILRALETLRVYRSLAGLGSGYRELWCP
ncbi:Myo-inositol catabolism IolC protein [Pseudomonas chlororaphis subsp. aurantiaca]|nr:Myo-inositol catabolism IolC protein [Pseudomonas chlororaphis subsp. aurantiaca]